MAGGKRLALVITGTQYPPAEEMRGWPPEERERAAVTTEAQVEAEYYRREDSHYLIYEEKGEGENDPVKTRIKYRNGILEMSRQGGRAGHMVFQAGRTHRTEYPTPCGVLWLDIRTDGVAFEIMDGCPRITADYVLENEGNPMGVYHLEIVEKRMP